jgi:hypothetical protein
VTKPHLILLAILILITSSCAMKHLLWDYMGAEKKISAKALPASGGYNLEDAEILALCLGAESVSSLDEADFLPNLLVNAPLLLLIAAAFFSSWVLVFLFQRKKLPTEFASRSSWTTIPIYLKLGRLVYYG